MQGFTMAAILTFLRYVGSSGRLFVGSTMSRVTSNIGLYYRAENTDITLTSNVGVATRYLCWK